MPNFDIARAEELCEMQAAISGLFPDEEATPADLLSCYLRAAIARIKELVSTIDELETECDLQTQIAIEFQARYGALHQEMEEEWRKIGQDDIAAMEIGVRLLIEYQAARIAELEGQLALMPSEANNTASERRPRA